MRAPPRRHPRCSLTPRHSHRLPHGRLELPLLRLRALPSGTCAALGACTPPALPPTARSCPLPSRRPALPEVPPTATLGQPFPLRVHITNAHDVEDAFAVSLTLPVGADLAVAGARSCVARVPPRTTTTLSLALTALAPGFIMLPVVSIAAKSDGRPLLDTSALRHVFVSPAAEAPAS